MKELGMFRTANQEDLKKLILCALDKELLLPWASRRISHNSLPKSQRRRSLHASLSTWCFLLSFPIDRNVAVKCAGSCDLCRPALSIDPPWMFLMAPRGHGKTNPAGMHYVRQYIRRAVWISIPCDSAVASCCWARARPAQTVAGPNTGVHTKPWNPILYRGQREREREELHFLEKGSGIASARRAGRPRRRGEWIDTSIFNFVGCRRISILRRGAGDATQHNTHTPRKLNMRERSLSSFMMMMADEANNEKLSKSRT